MGPGEDEDLTAEELAELLRPDPNDFERRQEQADELEDFCFPEED